MLDLYKNIRKYRLENKMTQDDLAKLTGYTDRSSIAKIEQGGVDLPQSKIMIFAKALNVDAGTLMGNTGINPDNLKFSLRSDESTLLADYRKLNAEGKQQALQQIRNLTKIEDYTKDAGSSSANAV